MRFAKPYMKGIAILCLVCWLLALSGCGTHVVFLKGNQRAIPVSRGDVVGIEKGWLLEDDFASQIFDELGQVPIVE